MGEERTKQWGTEILGDLWKGEGWGREHRVQDGHHRDFQDLTRQGTFGKESREFEGGGFGVDKRGKKRLWFWMGGDQRWC